MGIIELITTVLSVAFWFLKQNAAKNADPRVQRQRASEAIDREIVNNDSVAATLRVNEWLSIREGDLQRAGNY